MNNCQTTNNCHIIPRRYIKNFLNEDWEIFYADKNNNRKIKKSDNKFSFASRKNTYNFYDENKKNINDEFEKYLSKKETRIARISNKLITQFNKLHEQKEFKLTRDNKENIIHIIMLLYEKIMYHHMQNTYSKNEIQVTNEEDLSIIFGYLITMIPYFYCLLHIFILDDFTRYLIYSKKWNFYFWDIPLHINSLWKNIEIQSFFNSPWSSIIFPISKNYIIFIEYKKKNKQYLPLYNLNSKIFMLNFNKDIWERININCNEYLACGDLKYLNYLIKNKENISKYRPDIIFEQKQNILPKENKGLQTSFEQIKNYNYWITKMHLMSIKREFISKYKAIDKEFSKPCDIEHCIKIITWWNKNKIREILNKKKYIEIFRDSENNIKAINNYFNV